MRKKRLALFLLPCFYLIVLASCPSPVRPVIEPSPTAAPTPTPTPDTDPPVLSSLSAPTVIRDNQSFALSLSAVDAEDPALTVELYNGSTLLCPLTLTTNHIYTANYAGFQTERTYAGLVVTARDSAGNTASLPIPSLYIQSTNSYLSGITTTVGTLSPGFSPTTTYYTLSIPSGSTVNITATRASTKATATGTNVKSGKVITLTINVTAEAGSPYTTTYTVVATIR